MEKWTSKMVTFKCTRNLKFSQNLSGNISARFSFCNIDQEQPLQIQKKKIYFIKFHISLQFPILCYLAPGQLSLSRPMFKSILTVTTHLLRVIHYPVIQQVFLYLRQSGLIQWRFSCYFQLVNQLCRGFTSVLFRYCYPFIYDMSVYTVLLAVWHSLIQLHYKL